MFKSSLLLGHIRGIRIEVHVSWLVIFLLVSVSLSVAFRQGFPDVGVVAMTLLAAITALLFFVSIALHELGHSLVAIRRGVPVRAITLFIFGGVAQMERDSSSARDEFWIAIAGPLVSFALAVFFAMLVPLLGAVSELAATAVGWLAAINLIVAVFNLVPGFPLDGGRVFRAVVWGWTGDPVRGMRWAVAGGRLVAYALIGLGIYIMVGVGVLLSGIWLIAIGWFLLHNAEASGRDFTMRQNLRGLRARDLMERTPPRVESGTSVNDWIHDHALPQGRRSALVVRDDQPLGLVTFSDARKVDRADWPRTALERIMTPTQQWQTVEAEAPVESVLELVNRYSLNQVPVMENGRLVGWVDRERLLRTLQGYLELEQQRR